MSVHGSPLFASYTNNLRKLLWSESIDTQANAARPLGFRASLVHSPIKEDVDSLARVFEYHRHRTTIVVD